MKWNIKRAMAVLIAIGIFLSAVVLYRDMTEKKVMSGTFVQNTTQKGGTAVEIFNVQSRV